MTEVATSTAPYLTDFAKGDVLGVADADAELSLKGVALLNQVRTTAQMESMPRPKWLVDGLIPRGAFVPLFGPPDSFKSFIATAISAAIASGLDWCGRAVEQGRVLYQVGEGSAGIGQRTEAWRTDTGTDELTDLLWLPKALNVLDPEMAEAIVYVAKQTKPALVVFDTLARAIVGGDENTARDLGRAIETADRIREATGAAVMFVHHTTKDGATIRGHSVLEGAADVLLEMKRDRNSPTLTLSNVKQKDAERANPIRLSTRLVANSLVLDHLESVGSVPRGEIELLAVLRQHCPPEGLTPKQLRDLAELPERTFFRTMKPLRDRGEVINLGTDTRPRLVPKELEPE